MTDAKSSISLWQGELKIISSKLVENKRSTYRKQKNTIFGTFGPLV
jgi:hypothetical protein